MTPLEDATDASDLVGLDPTILWHGAARRVPLGASPPPLAPPQAAWLPLQLPLQPLRHR
jgi:hypothetical protein